MGLKNIELYTRFLVEKWRNPDQKTKYYGLAFIIVTFILAAGGIYIIGRFFTDNYIYVHSMHIPIIISAIIFRAKGGIAAGIVAGFIFGPFLPIDFGIDLLRIELGWVVRTAFFIAEGTIAGLTFEVLHYQFGRLEEASYYDPTTNLPNKLYLFSALEKVQQNNNINDYQLILIKVANYSEIINNFGHGSTSKLNQSIAQHIKSFLSQPLKVYNIHNNNFAVIIDSSYQKDNFNNIKGNLQYNGIPLYLELHLGIANLNSKITAEKALQNAHLAASEAKRKKLKVLEYDPSKQKKREKNLIILGKVRRAIRNEEFFLEYMPKMDLNSGEITGLEALIRWDNQQSGLISPGAFIPQVEKTALINELTMWVIEQAASDLKKLKKSASKLKMAVNITPRDLMAESFGENIIEKITAYSLSPEEFELELTETDIMEDIELAANKLNSLNQSGFKLALDDFGTGYSSLSYLKELPFNSIKVDRSFIYNIISDDKNREITATAIKLGHNLDCQVVAEGVEDQESLELLNQLNCDQIQGYYLSKALPFAEIKAWIENK